MVSEKKIEKRIKELVSEIKEHNQSYYDKDSPLITDFEYDMKLKELAYLEENFPHLVFVDSPLNKVGGTVSASFQKVTHQVPMLSLANSYSKQEIIDFDSRVTKSLLKEVDELKELRYCCELKMDGLAVSLIYKDGLLYKAITRGDGKIGEDVTENIKR
ncbi:MAG: NAD-dependent DNA ligase LigA, partial [Candidatus Riflemargulisbacteria bacterium]